MARQSENVTPAGKRWPARLFAARAAKLLAGAVGVGVIVDVVYVALQLPFFQTNASQSPGDNNPRIGLVEPNVHVNPSDTLEQTTPDATGSGDGGPDDPPGQPQTFGSITGATVTVTSDPPPVITRRSTPTPAPTETLQPTPTKEPTVTPTDEPTETPTPEIVILSDLPSSTLQGALLDSITGEVLAISLKAGSFTTLDINGTTRMSLSRLTDPNGRLLFMIPATRLLSTTPSNFTVYVTARVNNREVKIAEFALGSGSMPLNNGYYSLDIQDILKGKEEALGNRGQLRVGIKELEDPFPHGVEIRINYSK